LIQDAAHATEARLRGKSVALYGDTSCFSFYATKNLPLGEGGMLVTLDPSVAETARKLRTHGMSLDALQRHGDAQERWRHWEMERPGFNYTLTELTAYLGQQQLHRLDGWHARRAALVDRYRSRMASLEGVRTLSERPGIRHAHHLFVVLLDRPDLERDVFLPRLRNEGIECSVHYRGVHELDWYRRTYGWRSEDLPVASRASRTCITLPLHPLMDDAQVDLVADAMAGLLA
jgi:dTDP-4-amino-4,6-dideoxygalactose transaminase